jgi:hypothetical protein
MATQDHLATRFSGLLGTGMSKEDAWKVIAVEVLAEAGMIAPQQLGPPRIPLRRTESGRIPIYESKTIKVVRIDPEDDDRIRALLDRARRESSAAKSDAPTESAIIRQAIRLGLNELERQERQKVGR